MNGLVAHIKYVLKDCDVNKDMIEAIEHILDSQLSLSDKEKKTLSIMLVNTAELFKKHKENL